MLDEEEQARQSDEGAMVMVRKVVLGCVGERQTSVGVISQLPVCPVLFRIVRHMQVNATEK